MKGSSLFRRRAKTVTTVSIMLLPDHLLLAIAGHSTELVRQPIPLGESWSHVLAELFRTKKLLHCKVRVVLDSSQYQQLSIERPDVPAGALPWAIKDFTTEPVTQLAVDYYDSVTNPQARPRLQVVCTPKSRIQEWQKALQPLAELESVVIDELALTALFGEKAKVEVLLYQLAERDLLLLAVYKGQLCFSRVLRGFMPLVQLPLAQWPTSLLDNLTLEMQRSFDYLVSQLKLPEVASINVAINTLDSADLLLQTLNRYFGVPTQLMTIAAQGSSMEFLPVYGALLESQPATITVNACTNSDTSSCMKDTTASSSIALSAPISGWSSNPVTLTNGTGTVSLSHYTAENVKLGLSGSAYACFKNGVLDSTCELPFVSSALSFDIPTFTAGGDSDDVTLKAIKSDGSGACSALFSGSQPISFTNSYVTPTTVADLPQIINSSTSTATAISSNTSVVLTFNGNGVATFKLAYNNAGVLNLAAQYTKANTDTGVGTLTISGSDTVAVLPAAIRVEPADSAAICANTTHASCTKYKTVGDNFTLNAEAGYENDATWKKTSNFFTSQMSSLPVLQHRLLAPASGTLPSLTTTTLSFSGGTATTSISENDVGVYQYGVTDFVPYPDYQNESPKKMVPISWSDAIGRFVPAKLKTTLLSHGAFTSENCKANAVLTSLAYVGQELQFAALPMFSVVATDSNGNALQNYRDDFAKITTANPTATSIGVFTPSLVSKNNTTLIAAATWKAGSWLSAGNSHTYSFGDDRFIFAKSANHVNPFTTVLTLSALADSDGVVAISSVSPFYFYPWAANNSSAFNVYDGRLMLNSVNGAENAALTLPFYMQYWNGSVYALNTADHCSSLNATDLQMNDAANWSGINLRTSNSSSASATTNASLFPAVVAQGAGAILFTAPNNTGWVDISASSSLPLWMQDLSLSSGLAPVRASFGYYRGNDRLIYRREVFGGQ